MLSEFTEGRFKAVEALLRGFLGYPLGMGPFAVLIRSRAF